MSSKPERDASGVTLEELIEVPDVPATVGGSVIGMCVADDHPTFRGRVRVRWRDPADVEHEEWLACLSGTAPRPRDRVLLTLPANHDEPVVTGVLDGLSVRERSAPAESGPVIELRAGEAVRVTMPDGTPIVEVGVGDAGPEVRLLVADANVDLPGKLSIKADDVTLEARRGEINLDASGDVKIAGEVVRLN